MEMQGLTGIDSLRMNGIGKHFPCSLELSWLLAISIPITVHFMTESQPDRDTHVVNLLHALRNSVCGGLSKVGSQAGSGHESEVEYGIRLGLSQDIIDVGIELCQVGVCSWFDFSVGADLRWTTRLLARIKVWEARHSRYPLV